MAGILSNESEIIQIEQDYILYIINTNENTSSIVGNNDADGDIIIPSSIIYELKEYKIISISKDAFKQSYIKSMQFSPDSELQIIDEHAFDSSFIENFTIPPHLTKIGSYAFHDCKYFKIISFTRFGASSN